MTTQFVKPAPGLTIVMPHRQNAMLPETGAEVPLEYNCECGCMWTDEHEHTSNDRCPDCNTECEPSRSVDLNRHHEQSRGLVISKLGGELDVGGPELVIEEGDEEEGICEHCGAETLHDHHDSCPRVADLDRSSSVSRQHYIDTGRYLQKGEVDDA